MAIEWIGDELHVLVQKTADRTLKKAQKFFGDVFVDLSQEAMEYMQQVIATTPSSINLTKDNRIYTGVMIDAVQFSGVFFDGFNAESEVGWLRMQPYFLIQEHGGIATDLKYRKGPITVSPMHALTGAFLHMRADLEKKVREWA